MMMILTIALFICVILFFKLLVGKKKESKEEAPIKTIEYQDDALIWLNFINEHRTSIGLSELTPIQELHDRAQIVLEHIPPVSHYYDGQNYEIVGGEYATITALFRGYLNSLDGHKEIIELKELTYIGIGIKKLNNKYYNTTIFK